MMSSPDCNQRTAVQPLWLSALAFRASFLVALVLSSVTGFAEAPQEIGFIAKLKGKWLMDGKPACLAQPVSAGAALLRSPEFVQEHPNEGSITICYHAGGVFAWTSGVSNACPEPIQLRAPAATNSTRLQRALVAARELFTHDNSRFVPTLTRAMDYNLPDSVVVMKRNHVELSPLFKNMSQGHYEVIIAPVRSNGNTPTLRAKALACDWNSKPPLWIEVPNIRPGLYLISLMEKQSLGYAPAGEEPWILAVDKKRFESASKAFQEVLHHTEGWKGSVSQEVIRGFARAYLAGAAMEMEGKPNE